MNITGEPYAGKLQVRFDEGEVDSESSSLLYSIILFGSLAVFCPAQPINGVRCYNGWSCTGSLNNNTLSFSQISWTDVTYPLYNVSFILSNFSVVGTSPPPPSQPPEIWVESNPINYIPTARGVSVNLNIPQRYESPYSTQYGSPIFSGSLWIRYSTSPNGVLGIQEIGYFFIHKVSLLEETNPNFPILHLIIVLLVFLMGFYYLLVLAPKKSEKSKEKQLGISKSLVIIVILIVLIFLAFILGII